MEVKGELQKVLEIAHEFFAHAEKRAAQGSKLSLQQTQFLHPP